MMTEFDIALLQAREALIASGFFSYPGPDEVMTLALSALNLPASVLVVVTDAGEADPVIETGAASHPQGDADSPVSEPPPTEAGGHPLYAKPTLVPLTPLQGLQKRLEQSGSQWRLREEGDERCTLLRERHGQSYPVMSGPLAELRAHIEQKILNTVLIP